MVQTTNQLLDIYKQKTTDVPILPTRINPSMSPKIHQISPQKKSTEKKNHHPAAAIRARRPAMKSFRLATVTWRVVRPPGGTAPDGGKSWSLAMKKWGSYHETQGKWDSTHKNIEKV